MFLKTDQRKELEKEIAISHDKSQEEAVQWCLKHPVRGIAAMIALISSGNVKEEVTREWVQLPSWQNYLNSYDRLEEIEQEEGFPAMKLYAEQLDNIRSLLPQENTINGYYPFAGTDFYWARIFNKTVFEDIGYEKGYVKNMWWRPEKYSKDSINDIIFTLKKTGVLKEDTIIERITGDADNTREDNDFNKPEWTLVVKGGHGVINFLDKRFKEESINFGAIVVVDPADNDDYLKQGIEKRNYICTSYEPGIKFYSPYAMGMRHQYIFQKMEK